MFYSQFILAKKGPLGTIWIAAHLERKLRKNQVADTDIGVSVDSILFPDVPIALRLSSHLLLGVVRIYSRKVNYLFHDCSEALLKVKQAFRSTAVDLPPEESTAPYHSITLPETFDLDDFELPDSEIFLGNYVDHHISTREQITLQDSMDGVVYSRSQFGLDERFGDGDTSQIGFDLDEDMFIDKVTTPGHTMLLSDSKDDGHASGHPMTPFTDMDIDEDENKSGEDCMARGSDISPTDATEEHIDSNPQDQKMADNSCPLSQSHIQASDINDRHIGGSSADPSTDMLVCAQGPRAPGSVEEVVPANDHVQEVPDLIFEKGTLLPDSTEVILRDAIGNHQLESEYCDSGKFMAEESVRDTNDAGDSLLNNNSTETDYSFMANGGNGKIVGGLQPGDSSSAIAALAPIPFDVTRLVSSPTSVLAEQPKPFSLSERLDRTLGVSDMDKAETSQNGITSNEKCSPSFVDQTDAGLAPQGISLDTSSKSTVEGTCSEPLPGVEGSVSLNSNVTTDCRPVSESDCISHKETSEAQTFINVGHAGEHEFEKVEAKAFLEPEDTEIQNPAGSDENPSSHSHLLRACNSCLNKPNVSSLGDGNLVENVCDSSSRGAQPCTSEVLGREEAPHAYGTPALAQGEECHLTSDRVIAIEANQILESVPLGSVQADLSKPDDCLDAVISKDTQSQNLNCQESCDLPAPEVLLSAPAAGPDVQSDLLVEPTPEKEVSAECEQNADGLKNISGKKRHLMESTPVLLDGNSTKLSGVPRLRRTLDSIPDDDDLLSSILVGRSSGLKMRPTPSSPEIVPLKRRRLTPRVSVHKRKVHLDDAMVLHGDTIRQQLISTEDIRRIRRKAPCTRPEIWMIQKHLLEDEIFSEPLLTGISVDLIGLHNHTYDIMETRASKINANDTILEVPKEMELSRSTDVIIETSVEATGEPVVDGNDDGAHEPTKTSVQTENQSCEEHPINSIGCDTQEQTESLAGNPSLGLPIDAQLGEASAMVINNQDNGVSGITGHALTFNAGSTIESSSMDKYNGVETALENDENLDIQSVEKGVVVVDTTIYEGDDAINVTEVKDEGLILAEGVSNAWNGSVIQEIGSSGSVDVVPQERQDVDEGLSSPVTVPVLDNSSVENGVDATLDASIHMENFKHSFPDVSVGSHESTDLAVVSDDHAKEGIRSKVGVEVGDDFLAEKLKDDEGNSSSKLISSEEPFREHSCPSELHAGGENVHLNTENPNCEEANMGKLMDVESTALDDASVKDFGDFGNTIEGNDTEFLNFDDEEVDEEEEDNGMPSAEDARFLDNSGWSSRTRAVARYLQTLFDNESGQGRKALPMDNLLSGKTRKEASRMFFETLPRNHTAMNNHNNVLVMISGLRQNGGKVRKNIDSSMGKVLKTRDYIHVDQEKSFDNINIKPRAKLMKSDF